MFLSTIGCSVSGTPISVLTNFDLLAEIPPDPTFLIGGIHGDEPATVFLLESFWRNYGHLLQRPVAVLPLANPDGFNRNTRYNGRKVDLNRNFGFNWSPESEEPPGPAPWSEPEARALRDFILRLRPSGVVSLHWALAEIDADGPQSTELAHAMWEVLNEEERQPYRIRTFESNLEKVAELDEDCPGSLGQWCGYGLAKEAWGRAPAMITLELPYDPKAKTRPSPLPTGHLDQLRERWKRDPQGYLEGVEPGVHRMLLAACGERD